MPESNLIRILRTFHDDSCEFILVGGLAAVLNGAPIQTYDVDIVYSRSADNLGRVLTSLDKLEAIFRIQPQRRLQPKLSHLAGTGHLNLVTSAGPLDLLATVGVAAQTTYDDLLAFSEPMLIAEGVQIAVLKLEKLIELKEELGGEKDKAILPSLYQTLRLKHTSNES